jgi:hypothetical protein
MMFKACILRELDSCRPSGKAEGNLSSCVPGPLPTRQRICSTGAWKLMLKDPALSVSPPLLHVNRDLLIDSYGHVSPVNTAGQ